VDILAIAVLTVIAAGVGTLTGFGTSTIMVPALLLFLPLPQTLLIVGMIHWFGDIWKMVLFRTGIRWRLILLFGLAGMAASYGGASIVFEVPEGTLQRVLGGFLLMYVLYIFLKPTLKVPQRSATAIAGGALSGFFAGVFGVGGAIRTAFLSAFDLPKAVFIATAGAIAFMIDVSRLATYVINNVSLGERILWGFLLFVPASFIGATAGKKIVDRIPQDKFRTVIAFFLLLSGLKFLLLPG